MTVTLAVSDVPRPFPARVSPSASKNWNVICDFRGVADSAAFCFVVGRSMGPPATNAGLTNKLYFDFASALVVELIETPAGDYSGRETSTLSGLGGGAIGADLWVCLFEHKIADLVDGSVPAAVAGPFPCVA